MCFLLLLLLLLVVLFAECQSSECSQSHVASSARGGDQRAANSQLQHPHIQDAPRYQLQKWLAVMHVLR
jgi:hypothetical protein